MRIEFVKISEMACLARITRPDGALVETTATARDGIPHDLEHLIVEDAMHCDTGFWGRVCRGAEFSNLQITRKSRLRHPRSWHVELTKGYSGWDEDLVTKVVTMYYEARRQGWSPPAAFPSTQTMAHLLNPRRRPPARAVITREALEAAAAALREAERDWHALPVGAALIRQWDNRRAFPVAHGKTRDRGPAPRINRSKRFR